MKTSRTFGIIAGITAASIWGGMYVVSKVVLDVIPPFGLLTLRLLLGIITLGVVVAWKHHIHLTKRQTISLLFIGLLGYGISLGFQMLGTKLSTAANGAVVTSATPAFVFVFAYFILGEGFSKRRIAALVVSTIGVLAILDPRAARLTPQLFWGNLSLVAAALTWALYSVLIRNATRNMGALPVTFVALLGGLLIAIPGGVIESAQQDWGNVTLQIVAGVLYLGIISTALAAYLWNKAFEILEAGIASLTFFAQPVFGAVLGVVLLAEKLSPLFLFGSVLIGLGLWVAASEN